MDFQQAVPTEAEASKTSEETIENLYFFSDPSHYFSQMKNTLSGICTTYVDNTFNGGNKICPKE